MTGRLGGWCWGVFQALITFFSVTADSAVPLQAGLSVPLCTHTEAAASANREGPILLEEMGLKPAPQELVSESWNLASLLALGCVAGYTFFSPFFFFKQHYRVL